MEAINVSALEKFENGTTVDAKALLDARVLRSCRYGFKVLGKGELTKKLTVKAAAFSESAKTKIEAAGGKVEVV
ncbi:MAG: uL15 family ribosomal protein, partial [Oscillospiraceae bacterium]|nr:uL15 family ribosomal protein [Oscillospiraceae bacterium]